MEKNIKLMKKCEVCGINATSLCFQYIANFCDSCYKYNHDKEINSGHKKNRFLCPIDLKCPEHPRVPTNLFCLDEKGKLNTLILFFIFIELCCTYCYYKNMHSGHKK